MRKILQRLGMPVLLFVVYAALEALRTQVLVRSGIKFDADGTGNWRITPIARGAASLVIEQAVGEDGTDRATLGGDVQWVLHGGRYLMRKDA